MSTSVAEWTDADRAFHNAIDGIVAQSNALEKSTREMTDEKLESLAVAMSDGLKHHGFHVTTEECWCFLRDCRARVRNQEP